MRLKNVQKIKVRFISKVRKIFPYSLMLYTKLQVISSKWPWPITMHCSLILNVFELFHVEFNLKLIFQRDVVRCSQPHFLGLSFFYVIWGVQWDWGQFKMKDLFFVKKKKWCLIGKTRLLFLYKGFFCTSLSKCCFFQVGQVLPRGRGRPVIFSCSDKYTSINQRSSH